MMMTFPVFVSWIIYFVGYRFIMEPLFAQSLGIDKNVNQEIFDLQNRVTSQMDLFFIVTIVTSMIIIFFLGVVITNRLAGPMYRLRKYLSENQTGPFPKFRQHDFFSDLPVLIEKYLKNYNGKP